MSAVYPQLVMLAGVSVSHMSMPNHWLPYVMVSRANNWSLRTAVCLTFLGALGHVSVTLFLTLALSRLISQDYYRVLSTSILIILGIYYLYTYFISRRRDSCCEEKENTQKPTSEIGDVSANRAAAISVVMLTTLSPCTCSMPVLLTILTPPVQIITVLLAGGVLFATAATVMMVLVSVSYVGAKALDFTRIRRHERLMMGVGLILLALVTVFLIPDHHHHHHHEHDLHATAREKGHAGCSHAHGKDAHVQHDQHVHNDHHGDDDYLPHDSLRILQTTPRNKKHQVEIEAPSVKNRKGA